MREKRTFFRNNAAALLIGPFFLLLGTSAVRAQLAPPLVAPLEEIEKSGSISISDGSSFYMFAKDGTFRSGPLGMSGRTMIGRWEKDRDGRLIAQARLGWVNGLSSNDQYRRIVFAISYIKKRSIELKVPFLSSTEVSDSYFVIDEMTVIPKPDFKFPE